MRRTKHGFWALGISSGSKSLCSTHSVKQKPHHKINYMDLNILEGILPWFVALKASLLGGLIIHIHDLVKVFWPISFPCVSPLQPHWPLFCSSNASWLLWLFFSLWYDLPYYSLTMSDLCWKSALKSFFSTLYKMFLPSHCPLNLLSLLHNSCHSLEFSVVLPYCPYSLHKNKGSGFIHCWFPASRTMLGIQKVSNEYLVNDKWMLSNYL